MIRNIVQCEVCPASFDYDPMKPDYTRTLPEPWLALFSAGLLSVQQPRHFCSASCLQRYLSETCGPTIEERIKAWEEAHPEVDCTNTIIHPYYTDALKQSMSRLFRTPPAEQSEEQHV